MRNTCSKWLTDQEFLLTRLPIRKALQGEGLRFNDDDTRQAHRLANEKAVMCFVSIFAYPCLYFTGRCGTTSCIMPSAFEIVHCHAQRG
jgi:hypothetical protein